MSRYGWRPHIESALVLNIGRLRKDGLLRSGSGSLHWHNSHGKEVASAGFRCALSGDSGALTLQYNYPDPDSGERKDVECFIPISSVPLNYGGRRWFMHCPYTGQRAVKLYKFSRIDKFCHRTSVRPLPTYESQRVSGASRIFDQRWRLRRRLGDTVSDLFSEPVKPKWMRWRTFEKYAACDAELEARESDYLLRLLGHYL